MASRTPLQKEMTKQPAVYTVIWRTKVEALNADEAALKAWFIMQDRNTCETIVEVELGDLKVFVDTEELPR